MSHPSPQQSQVPMSHPSPQQSQFSLKLGRQLGLGPRDGHQKYTFRFENDLPSVSAPQKVFPPCSSEGASASYQTYQPSCEEEEQPQPPATSPQALQTRVLSRQDSFSFSLSPISGSIESVSSVGHPFMHSTPKIALCETRGGQTESEGLQNRGEEAPQSFPGTEKSGSDTQQAHVQDSPSEAEGSGIYVNPQTTRENSQYDQPTRELLYKLYLIQANFAENISVLSQDYMRKVERFFRQHCPGFPITHPVVVPSPISPCTVPTKTNEAVDQNAADTYHTTFPAQTSTASVHTYPAMPGAHASYLTVYGNLPSAGLPSVPGFQGSTLPPHGALGGYDAQGPGHPGVLQGHVITPVIMGAPFPYDGTTNPGMYNPEMYNPGVNDAGMDNPGMYNPGVYNPGVYNPGVYDPGMDNPGMYNPGVYNPGVYNPGMDNPGMYNPGMDNPEMYNPGVYNPYMYNPGMSNPGMNNPGMNNPEMNNPEMNNPEMNNPGMNNPEVNNPEMNNPEINNPGMNDPGMNDPGMNNPGRNNPRIFLADSRIPRGSKQKHSRGEHRDR
ncbi:hypothetical protein ACOMHN_035293 [Nucella lapillus]